MGRLIGSLLDLYWWFIIVYVVLSWVVMTSRSSIVADIYRVLSGICEPYIGLFRRIIPPIALGSGGLDLSPIIALFVLQAVASFVRTLG